MKAFFVFLERWGEGAVTSDIGALYLAPPFPPILCAWAHMHAWAHTHTHTPLDKNARKRWMD